MLHSTVQIGPYTLLRSLGRGTYGEVWLAERRSSLLTTQVALKLPHEDTSSLDEIRAEAQIWLRASGHPNIVPFLEAEIYNGRVVIASEYVAGGSLADWLLSNAGKAPSVEVAAQMLDGILAGLDFLHRHALIHRDLKPANILLQDGIPRLTDFGLTRVLRATGQTANPSGTPAYMPPEAFDGQFSPASDIWAAGVILYRMLTGRLPFAQQGVSQLIRSIVSEEPDALPTEFPDGLRALIARSLSKSPADRFASAMEMRKSLLGVSIRGATAIVATARSSQPAPPNNLPLQVTSFIGRERERAEIKSRLKQTRLLTLTGPGGCGKTRLAIETAQDLLRDYPDGIWFVDLASAASSVMVPQATASALQLAEQPGYSVLQTLTEYLKEKNLLLILDNCEHVLAGCAQLAMSLFGSCPHVSLLATSRERLNVPGETTCAIPSLSLPDPRTAIGVGSIQNYDAIRLFVERAARFYQDFTVTPENASVLTSVCHQLDGIPLAIELAAARLRSLSLDEMHARLSQDFRLLTGGSRAALPRQQTLRALIDWSYDMLTVTERALFCRLSVFAGGWTIDTAESICADNASNESADAVFHQLAIQGTREKGAGSLETEIQKPKVKIEEWMVLDLLTSLADKSLVNLERDAKRTRFRMLETVRQYARDRLEESGEAAIWRIRHRDYFLAWGEQQTQSVGDMEARKDFEKDLDNLRAALDYSLSDPAQAAAWLHSLGQVFNFLTRAGFSRIFKFIGKTGRYQEIMGLCLRALEATKDVGGLQERGWVLLGTACGLANAGRYKEAWPLFEESREIGEKLEQPPWIVTTLINYGNALNEAGELVQAREVLEEGLALAQRIGDPLEGVHCALGETLALAGELDQAEHLLTVAKTAYSALEHWGALSEICCFLGRIAQSRGSLEYAHSLFLEALEIHREHDVHSNFFVEPYCMAILAWAQQEFERSARLFGAHDAERASLGRPLSPIFHAEYSSMIVALRAALGDREFDAAYGNGKTMTFEQTMNLACEEKRPAS